MKHSLDDSIHSLPQHWLDSQRLMVGLTLALIKGTSGDGIAALLDRALCYLRPPVTMLTSTAKPSPEDEQTYMKRLETVHPATLKRLTEIDDQLLSEPWRSHKPLWIRAYKGLHDDGTRFPVVGARLIADRIANSRLTSEQIVRLGAAELSEAWAKVTTHSQLDAVLKSARAVNRNPRDLLAKLTDFREAGPLNRWELVENALLQQIFIWPLLVLETEDVGLEFSLPVLLETSFAQELLPPIIGGGILTGSEWEPSVRKATYAAKRLWQNKRGASAPWLKDKVDRLSASVDLTFAEKIVSPFDVKIDLSGDSAEAYFALAILGSLTDPQAVENLCATGSIGEERPDPEGGGDHRLDEPGWVEEKLAYARSSYFFDTFLVPKPSLGIKSEKHIHVPREVTVRHRKPEVTFFSHFADHVFGQKWRKQQYVRAPDLAEAFKPMDRTFRNSKEREFDLDVKRVRERLNKNYSSPVLHFDDISPERVAEALYFVNLGAAKGGRSNGKNSVVGKNLVGSFAFIRAVPDAINDRMWWPIWDLISGEQESFFHFQFAASTDVAARHLAREMNKNPTKEDPRRAPDILVVAYTDPAGHFGSDQGIAGSPFERLKLGPMMEAINGLPDEYGIKRSQIPKFHEWIGRTRIILVRDVGAGRFTTLDEAPKDESWKKSELGRAFGRLSIFRYGFTREHAKHILNVAEDDCDRILSQLTEREMDGRKPLAFTDGADEYYRQWNGSNHVAEGDHGRLHFEAANALTGILIPREGSFRTKLRSAFAAANVQEAQWHLQQAQQHARRTENTSFLGEVRSAQARLSRLAEPFGWTSVRWLQQQLRNRRAGNRKSLEGADFLLSSIESHFTAVERGQEGLKTGFWRYSHPLEYVLAARYASELALEGSIAPGRRDKLLDLREKYLAQARKRIDSDREAPEEERQACRFNLAAARLCMMAAEFPDERGVATTNGLAQIISSEMNYCRFLDRGDRDLFEYLGDRESEPSNALRWYKRGICNDQIPWMQPWPSLAFKYLGAAKTLGVSPSDDAKSALDDLWRHIHPQHRTIPVAGFFRIPHVVERWKIGKQAATAGNFCFGTYGA